MDGRMKQSLDKHITGNYGEDQYPEEKEDCNPKEYIRCLQCNEAMPRSEFLEHFRTKHEAVITDFLNDFLREAEELATKENETCIHQGIEKDEKGKTHCKITNTPCTWSSVPKDCPKEAKDYTKKYRLNGHLRSCDCGECFDCDADNDEL